MLIHPLDHLAAMGVHLKVVIELLALNWSMIASQIPSWTWCAYLLGGRIDLLIHIIFLFIILQIKYNNLLFVR